MEEQLGRYRTPFSEVRGGSRWDPERAGTRDRSWGLQQRSATRAWRLSWASWERKAVPLPPFCSSLAPREAHCVVPRSWWKQMERGQKGANRTCSGPPPYPLV